MYSRTSLKVTRSSNSRQRSRVGGEARGRRRNIGKIKGVEGGGETQGM